MAKRAKPVHVNPKVTAGSRSVRRTRPDRSIKTERASQISGQPGMLLAPAGIYFALLGKAHAEQLNWLKRQLHDNAIAWIIATPNGSALRSFIAAAVSYARGRRSVAGVESILATAVQSLRSAQSLRLRQSVMAAIRDLPGQDARDHVNPLCVYDR